MPSDQTLTKIPPSLWPIFIFVVLLFCQVWWDFAGFTFRSEDLLALGLIVLYLLKSSYHKKIGYYQSVLNKPILAWAAILVIGIFITWVFSYDAITKKDALVNGVRLILAVGMFFVVNNHPAPAKSKLRAVFLAILSFSFITTTVAYLQMGFWDGWLPISLPAALTTFKEGANMAQGRELFALYLGNTGSHTWSGALAMQGLLVWLVARYIQKPWLKWAAGIYFILLMAILVRTSVRNSVLGLFLTIIALELFRLQPSKDLFKALVKICLLSCFVFITIYALLHIAPDNYFFNRVRQTIPMLESGQLSIHRGSNIYGRFFYWEQAIEMFKINPIIGNGFYSYSAIMPRIGLIDVPHAHNAYLHILAEFGLIGFIVFGWLLLKICMFLFSNKHILTQSEVGFWLNYVIGILIFLSFTSLFSNTFFTPALLAFFMVSLAVLVSLKREQ